LAERSRRRRAGSSPLVAQALTLLRERLRPVHHGGGGVGRARLFEVGDRKALRD
jgi:hypothetical protein